MLHILVGFLTLGFAGLTAFRQKEELEQILSSAQYLNPLALEVYFLVGVSLYLIISGITSSRRRSILEVDSHEAEVRSFLTLLQEKGRLLDFVLDDITPYSDEQVGKVARVVHQGVKEVLADAIQVEPVYSGQEGETISVSEDSESFRFIGNRTGKPPFSGKVLHKGWRARHIRIPRANMRSDVIQPAEIEVDV